MRYTLEQYSGHGSRFPCPNCGNSTSFTRYIDNEKSQYLRADVGICNRKNKCNYHYTPKQFFRDGNSVDVGFSLPPKVNYAGEKISIIDTNYFQSSLKCYENNNFVKYLESHFSNEVVKKTIETFYIGTSKFYDNATVFWQVDIQGEIRGGKIIKYDSEKGKKIKYPFPHINWVHKVLKINNFCLKQCLFGEHQLIKNNNKVIALVESEKTAIIASIYLPEFVWLATGGIHNLEPIKCSALRDKQIIMFPDVNAFDLWKDKAAGLSSSLNCSIQVSNLLEKNVPDEFRNEGYDIADFLLQDLEISQF